MHREDNLDLKWKRTYSLSQAYIPSAETPNAKTRKAEKSVWHAIWGSRRSDYLCMQRRSFQDLSSDAERRIGFSECWLVCQSGFRRPMQKQAGPRCAKRRDDHCLLGGNRKHEAFAPQDSSLQATHRQQRFSMIKTTSSSVDVGIVHNQAQAQAHLHHHARLRVTQHQPVPARPPLLRQRHQSPRKIRHKTPPDRLLFAIESHNQVLERHREAISRGPVEPCGLRFDEHGGVQMSEGGGGGPD